MPDLVRWFENDRRDLPWRHTRDPWAVLVSEVMLQQTQVDRVIPRWRAFLERFPTAGLCASAPLAAVLELWVGLGYNRRAVNLWRAAKAVTDHHGGVFPDRLDGLLALPGVGPYTARAVLAFAFEADVAVVDTNVGRVLARVSGRSLTLGKVQRMADELVRPGSAWVHNQAMLDVGATICRARVPACEGCPFRSGCAWAAAGHPLPDPAFGSGGVSGRQSRFAGSDRQGRGRLVAALREGPVAVCDLPAAMGWPGDADRAARVVAGLVADGLVAAGPEGYRLP